MTFARAQQKGPPLIRLTAVRPLGVGEGRSDGEAKGARTIIFLTCFHERRTP